ncbi:membrane protein insertase YidC [Nocardioides zeae]|uniref:Membrane protein insertase YidC n=1 Tax=Nocardioides imazamoxiresistens TaxID=3231893 RepID=A0ABU3PT24_9ACTN|nr:membrane protein insertase YidC [Nocardioides zeae]MDT9592348.1 membrane protein insertase YidC [Nocardioides zeae]
MSVLDPVTHALAAALATAHHTLEPLLDPLPSGVLWVAAITTLVVGVRLLVLPLAVHGVRQAHASARARPALQDLARRHRGARSPEAVAAYRAARAEVARENGVSRLGCLPLLVQVPVWIGLYHLLSDVAGGQQVGAMGSDLVASVASATLLGVPLVARGYVGGATHVAVVAALAGTVAVLSFVTQRFLVAPNQVLDGVPEAVARAQALMPALTALGMLVAASVVPVALLVYWLVNATWTAGQAAVVVRRFPTPGSPAALARASRTG